VTSPLFVDGEPEYIVEKIKRARLKKMGKGSRRKILVKWKGYEEEIWELREEFLETEALAQFERKFGTGDRVDEKDSGPIIVRGVGSFIATGDPLLTSISNLRKERKEI
jgi:hypothetical protein